MTEQHPITKKHATICFGVGVLLQVPGEKMKINPGGPVWEMERKWILKLNRCPKQQLVTQ